MVFSEPRELYVRPEGFHDCQANITCRSIWEYSENATNYFTSNTTVYFLPGVHSINKTMALLVSNVSNISLKSYDSQQPIEIQCNGNAAFHFMNITNLSITNMQFIGCSFKDLELIGDNYFHSSSISALRFDDIDSLVLINVQVRHSYGYGVFAVNVLGKSVISGCRFYMNKRREINEIKKFIVIRKGEPTINGSTAAGGNALFIYTNPYAIIEPYHALHISKSEFAHGIGKNKWRIYFNYGIIPMYDAATLGGVGGLGILLYQGEYVKNLIQPPSYNLAIYISKCSFYNNTAPFGANMFLFRNSYGNYATTVYVNNCTFHSGIANSEGGGLYIRNEQMLYMHISHSLFSYNRAERGGGLYLSSRIYENIMTSNNRIELHDCHFHENMAVEGGGTYTLLDAAEYYSSASLKLNSVYLATDLHILECVYSQNQASSSGGSIHVQIYTLPQEGKDVLFNRYVYNRVKHKIMVNISSCNFSNNSTEIIRAVTITACGRQHYPCMMQSSNVFVTVQDTTFSANSVFNQLHSRATAVLYLHNVKNVTIRNSKFIGNNASAIYANASTLFFEESVTLANNRGHSGGAIHLECNHLGQSLLYFNTSNLLIINNTVEEYGGAIAVETYCSNYNMCFFQLPHLNVQELLKGGVGPGVVVANNIAGISGNLIYGGSLDSCILSTVFGYVHLNYNMLEKILQKINPRNSSEIASNPYMVCFCNASVSHNKGKCIRVKEIITFQGQEFKISVATAGQYGGASPGVVRTKIVTVGESAKLGPREDVQQLDDDCGELTYSIRTFANSAELHLYVESALNSPWSPSIIRIFLQPCPFGFELLGNPPKCSCVPHLSLHKIICDIDTQTFHYPAGMWIGNYSGDITAQRHCPLDYCNPGAGEIIPSAQDSQCAFNHSGILCGGCQPGLSIVLGTSRCQHCSNTYLLLIIPFALVGVALVFLLLKCNMTVSTGTINGLIFYANIVKVNHTIFFPHSDTSSPLTKFLSIFIAWLNLDLGIQTCFFSGLDVYCKTWLQFLFPVYIWVLVITLIYGSKHSVMIGKLTGSNATQVLATLLLLSYSKLLRTMIDAVSPIHLIDKDGITSTHWLLDANMPYFKGPHAALFVMAIVATVLFVVPFTVLILLAQCLQARSGYWALKWINRLKPLLDAFQGPYKDRFRYWTGLMLLARIALFTVSASNVLGDPRINLFVITTLVSGIPLFFWRAGSVYKRLHIHLLQAFFFLNLTVFAAGTLFLKSVQASARQETLTCIMVGSTFVIFCIIVGYHFYRIIPPSMHDSIQRLVAHRLKKKHCNDLRMDSVTGGNIHCVHAASAHTVSVIELRGWELREPLLTDRED